MSLFTVSAILLTLAALFGTLNSRWLKLNPAVGLLLISLTSSLGVMLIHWLWPGFALDASIRGFLRGIDFNAALMHGMLGFLLFAGALHADLDYFLQRRLSIGLLATVGLLISTALVGVMAKLLFGALGLEASWLACLVFGALISPTDPIAVMGTLKSLHAPPALEAKIAGESLFNDGVAVVVFTGLVALIESHGGGASGGHGHGGEALGPMGLIWLFLREAGGGALLGLAAGYVTYRLMLAIDDYKVEVMLSLALVMGGYSLAGALHLSGPIAVVTAGIFIGNRGRALAMSETVADYLEKFWELLDEILNAVLFLLIGVEVLLLSFSARSALAGLACIAIVLLARLVSVALPIGLLRSRRIFNRGVVRILTWAGLRGGISVALALSLPPIPEKSLILTCTYVVVLFSILVQGMTVGRVLRRYIQ
ncbi:MAG: sodium:proton antiporter [Candidatus Krumholzibacteriia bacterium]|nr:sodium:proton antiporter [bacterium]MCB9517166.1 sodium:proton antiporter [Candidatus Latescibacterota bacterium]